jgi:hypothetical protein
VRCVAMRRAAGDIIAIYNDCKSRTVRDFKSQRARG